MYNFYQVRYSSEGAAINTNEKEDLTSGTAFNGYGPIIQLGIQAPPGTKVYLNGNSFPVIIGHTGLFDLDLSNTDNYISSIAFDENSISSLIENNPSNYIIVDLCCGEGGNN